MVGGSPLCVLVQLVTLSFAKLPVARRAVGADWPALRKCASAPRLFGREGRGVAATKWSYRLMRGALSPWGLARALQQPATQAAISTQRRCSRLARVQHDSSRRATAVEGAKLARVKSEDVFDWPVVVHQMCKMVRVHGARSSRGAAGESDLGSPQRQPRTRRRSTTLRCSRISPLCLDNAYESLWMMKTYFFFPGERSGCGITPFRL